MKYIPGLNGLRAIAALMVVIYHWTLPLVEKTPSLKYFILDGNFGVNIFFVLSGFLITGILLNAKTQKEESATKTSKGIFFNFYVRRSLRIFPVYYLTLFVLLVIGLPGFNHNLVYYLTYTENFNVFIKSYWDSFSHTWSLAVEEQFYLIWPFVIIYTKKKKLPLVFVCFILVAPLFSIFQTYILHNPLNAFILTPSCFDAFGIGGLLAYYYSEKKLGQVKKWIKILLPLALILSFTGRWHPPADIFNISKGLMRA